MNWDDRQALMDSEQRENDKRDWRDTISNCGECGYKCVRLVFFCFNLLLFLAGCVILGIGIWLHSKRDDAARDYAHLSGNVNFVNGPNFCIAIGIVTVLISFLACWGTRTQNLCMLGCYCALLGVIFCLQVAAISITYIYRERIDESLRVDFDRTLQNYNVTSHESLTGAIDELQRDFACCGNHNYSDWFHVSWGKNNLDRVPISCCRLPRTNDCNLGVTTTQLRIHTEGCYSHVKKYLLENLHIVSGFGLWIAVIEILGIVFSITLIIKTRKERMNYA